MLHDGGPMKSVLAQGGIKKAIFYIATGRAIDDEILKKYSNSSCLIELWRNKRGNSDFVPLYTYYHKKSTAEKRPYRFPSRLLTFDDWWERDIIGRYYI
jgi:hypothetical protein